MAGTTTYYGISYPTSTDYVKDGATAMQTIADGFDSAVAIPTYNNQTGTSYTFVLADAGKTVTSNNASAVTFTIPPQASVAWANNTTLTVRNLGAGVVTIAGGAGVTVTNTALTVGQYASVRIIRTASNAWTVTPAGGASGLTLISSTTFSAATSVDFTNAFSSTYDNYRVIFEPTSSTNNTNVDVRLLAGSTASTVNYYYGYVGVNNAGTGINTNGNDVGSFLGLSIETGQPESASLIMDFIAPNKTRRTRVFVFSTGSSSQLFFRSGSVIHAPQVAYDGFRFLYTGTIGGIVSIYGYQK